MPGLVSRNKTLDTLTIMRDGAAITSSAAATVGGSAKILDVGGANAVDGVPETRFECVIDVTAIDIATDNESYDIVVQGSNGAAFATATDVVELCGIHLGASQTKRTDSDVDDTVGRYRLFGVNERDGTWYRYLRLYTVVGATGSSIDYVARLAYVASGQ